MFSYIPVLFFFLWKFTHTNFSSQLCPFVLNLTLGNYFNYSELITSNLNETIDNNNISIWYSELSYLLSYIRKDIINYK